MPYLGMRPDGEAVVPLDVDEHESIRCPLCEGELRIRRSHYNRGRFVSRHFFHTETTDCPGESDLQSKLKTIAAMNLRQVFNTATIAHDTAVGDQVVDVLAVFKRPLPPLGDGLVVEIQSEDGMDIEVATEAYLRHGYSVYWAHPADFDGHDMTVSQERLRTVWPEAVPLIEGIEGYHECVQTLLNPPAPDPPVTLEIPFPNEYWRAHALEIISPSRGRRDDELAAPGWEALDTVWLHGEGHEIEWVNVLRAPSKDIFLEFWVKDRQTTESHFLPVRVDATVVDAFEEFLDTARTTFEEEDTYRSTDDWILVASLDFAGTQACESWLSIAKPPYSRLKIIVGRRDRKGNTRTISSDYRKDDLSRLARLRHSLATLFDHSKANALA